MKKQDLLKYSKLLAVLMWVCIVALLITFRAQISVETITSFAPQQPVFSVLAILLLYMFHTLSIVFPLKLVQLAAGVLFPIPAAIAVNLAGIAVSSAVGYGMGAFLGRDAAETLIQKNPRLTRLIAQQNSDVMFFAFFLRSLVFLPLDVVSMYFGASKSDFKKYMAGSLLGMLPNTIISSVMGDKMTDPTSPAFLLACTLFLCISAVSVIWYILYLRRRNE